MRPAGSVICRLEAEEFGSAGGVGRVGAVLRYATSTLKGALDCRGQFGQLTFDGAPDNLRVDVEVAVNKPIAHADHRAPRNLGRCRTRVVRYFSCRFADDLEGPHCRKEKHRVGIEIVTVTGAQEADCGLRCVQHVLQADPVIRQHIESERYG